MKSVVNKNDDDDDEMMTTMVMMITITMMMMMMMMIGAMPGIVAISVTTMMEKTRMKMTMGSS